MDSRISNRLRFVSFFLIFGGLAFLAGGCGGGGGKTNYAPSSLKGHTLTFYDADLTNQKLGAYTYAATSYTSSDGGGDSGAYTYARVSGVQHQATLQMVTSFGGTTTNYHLTYTSKAGGTYLDSNTSKTGTFTSP